ncbi:unnamed protein product [Rotaria sordida]|uniref:Uncharacterized protein n=1 Tax=Rotaria sordida TaxID=392033 RepID=A0A815FRR4_9BILA|nr:unnamed protein product [Rotaria sordida]CAF1323067.1 unnamed protein product [Rotaria sordida]CAF1462481.1 unnamed protein product [Rotaria sordida]CAF3852886.1 unnamed protein product [Rotaria sordida]
MDTWDKKVLTIDVENMEVDEDNNEQNIVIKKENLAETVQMDCSLTKTIRCSQILIMFINNEKKLKTTRQLINDCICKHKTIMLNPFESKGKLPIASKQKEKLTLLEISSDDWMIIINLMNMFE